MMSTMWVYLETWMVKDGALPEIGRASHLRGVGLCADCRNVGAARTAMDGIAELVDPGGEQGSGSYRHELTGVGRTCRRCAVRTGTRRLGVRDHYR
jgi:hypothetical protein